MAIDNYNKTEGTDFSIEKQKEDAQKSHEEKQRTNDRINIEVFQRIFQKKLDMHYNLMQMLKHAQQNQAIKGEEMRHAKSEQEYSDSMSSYSANSGLLNRNLKDSIYLDDIQHLIGKINNDITKLENEIRNLNKIINDEVKELQKINGRLSEKIVDAFKNPEKNKSLPSDSITFHIPSKYRNVAPVDRFQGNIKIDKELYVEIALQLADNMQSSNMTYNPFSDRVLAATTRAIENQIRLQLEAIPSIPTEAINMMVQDILNQPKTKALIASVSQQALSHLISNNEISGLIDLKTEKERKIEYLKLKVSEKQHTIDSLNSLIDKAESLKGSNQDIVDQLEKIQYKHQKIQDNSSTPMAEAIEPFLEKTDACIEELNKIAAQTTKDASNPSINLDLNQKSAEIDNVANSHNDSAQNSLNALLNIFEESKKTTPEEPTSSPSPH